MFRRNNHCRRSFRTDKIKTPERSNLFESSKQVSPGEWQRPAKFRTNFLFEHFLTAPIFDLCRKLFWRNSKLSTARGWWETPQRNKKIKKWCWLNLVVSATARSDGIEQEFTIWNGCKLGRLYKFRWDLLNRTRLFIPNGKKGKDTPPNFLACRKKARNDKNAFRKKLRHPH